MWQAKSKSNITSLLLLTQLIFKRCDAQSTINTLRKEEIFRKCVGLDSKYWQKILRNSFEVLILRSLGLVRGRSYRKFISFKCQKQKKKKKNPPPIQGLLGFILLAKMYLSPTLGRSGSDFLDNCPIKALLEGFYTKVWAGWTLFKIISSLMRLAKWLQCIKCGGDGCFVHLLSFLSRSTTNPSLCPWFVPHNL